MEVYPDGKSYLMILDIVLRTICSLKKELK